MKTLKLAVVIATLVFASCSEKEEEPTPTLIQSGPEISYAETSFETTFHAEGSSNVPTLNWNGEVGTLSLSNFIQGINLNSDNGVLSWYKSLPLGLSEVTVVATNSIGQKTVTLQIENEFKGDFKGGYNGDPNSQAITVSDFKLNFKSDGSMTASDFGSPALGDWTRDGNTITAVYSYNGGSSFYTVVGELKYNNAVAELEGLWYTGNQAIAANLQGYFLVELD